MPAYASQITMAVLDDGKAEELRAAVRTEEGCRDARHPVRAVQLPVEDAAACRAGA